MNTRIRQFALASAITLALSLSGSPALSADVAPGIVNARMESQIWTTYTLSPYLRSSDIRVTVLDGKATLEGVVDESVNKDLAEQIALGVDGVTEVDNQISVKADYRPPAAPVRTRYATRVEDASTSAAVRAKLSWSRHETGDQIEVSTVKGKVTLQGQTYSDADKAYITKLARNTRGVSSVDNRMLVIGASESVAARDESSSMAEAIADTWITTKVKSTFMYSSNVDSANISVSTLAGVVTLSGTVISGPERALAIELAQNVRGVKSVESADLSFTPLDRLSATSKR